jgi:hypothetical protein
MGNFNKKIRDKAFNVLEGAGENGKDAVVKVLL